MRCCGKRGGVAGERSVNGRSEGVKRGKREGCLGDGVFTPSHRRAAQRQRAPAGWLAAAGWLGKRTEEETDRGCKESHTLSGID